MRRSIRKFNIPPPWHLSQFPLPFFNIKSPLKKQLSDLRKRIDHTLQPVFRSCKIGEDLKMCKPKPPLVNQQCVVYNYQCDLCDAEYVGYISRHLHQRIDEHRFSVISKHLKNDHGIKTIGDLNSNFSVLKKCGGKLDCLIYAPNNSKVQHPPPPRATPWAFELLKIGLFKFSPLRAKKPFKCPTN